MLPYRRNLTESTTERKGMLIKHHGNESGAAPAIGVSILERESRYGLGVFLRFLLLRRSKKSSEVSGGGSSV
jgi:hypothetical protein